MTQRRKLKAQDNCVIDGSLALEIERQRQYNRQSAQKLEREVLMTSRQAYTREEPISEQEWERRVQEERRVAARRQRRLEAESLRQLEHRVEERQTLERITVRRRNKKVAAIVLLVTLVLGGFSFFLLYRQSMIEKGIVRQNTLNSQIKEYSKRIEDLEVQVNAASNIGQIKDYAQTQLNMDYPTEENTRRVVLPNS